MVPKSSIELDCILASIHGIHPSHGPALDSEPHFSIRKRDLFHSIELECGNVEHFLDWTGLLGGLDDSHCDHFVSSDFVVSETFETMEIA